MKVEIESLKASDFSDINGAKFNEWKVLKIKKTRERKIAVYIGIGLLLILSVVSVLTARPIFLAVFVILIGIDDLVFFYRRRHRHLRHLAEDLMMSARMRAKKEGRAFIE
jgi:Flp pilus assembly protein TadB